MHSALVTIEDPIIIIVYMYAITSYDLLTNVFILNLPCFSYDHSFILYALGNSIALSLKRSQNYIFSSLIFFTLMTIFYNKHFGHFYQNYHQTILSFYGCRLTLLYLSLRVSLAGMCIMRNYYSILD